MMELGFLIEKKILARLEKRTIFVLTCFVMKISCFFLIYVSNQKLKTLMDLLLIIDGDKSHYVYIKGFVDRFMFHKTKYTFTKVVYSVLVLKVALMVHSL